MLKRKGFIFIETIIVVCVLTVALMSLYVNYSNIITNTRELNTFDTTEYNYKTYFLKKLYENGKLLFVNKPSNNLVFFQEGGTYNYVENNCYRADTVFNYEYINNSTWQSPERVKICFLKDASQPNYIEDNYSNFDAYIIDYLNSQDLTENNDNLFLVEYKKYDKQTGEYFTYISSLNF